MMVGVTKWSYAQDEIDGRNENCEIYGEASEKCKNEAWFMRELSQQLEDKFDVKRELTFAFMDSFSQSSPELDDEIQQLHWIEETNKLWSEAMKHENKPFDFKTIDEVLEENAACKEENADLKKDNDDLRRKIKQFTSSEIIGLQILTGENECDSCDISFTIQGPRGSCFTGSLDNEANNWESYAGDIFSGEQIGNCERVNLGNVDSSGWKITVHHSGSDGWKAEKAWILFESGAFLYCNIDADFDNTSEYEFNCTMGGIQF